ncbi:MAG: hypothetical protein P8Y42_16435 [Exilibacterium sp.]
MKLQPRLIRMRDAPKYLGMDRNRFNTAVRPHLTQIPLGTQAIAFDRLEIDAWLEDYIECNGRRPKASKLEDDTCPRKTKCQGFAAKVTSGKSKNAVNISKAVGSEKAREHLTALRQKKS